MGFAEVAVHPEVAQVANQAGRQNLGIGTHGRQLHLHPVDDLVVVPVARVPVRQPREGGTGYGQALLLWPTSGQWPQDGELDFAESPHGDKKTVAQTIHWGSDNQIDYRWVNGDFTAWHTYAVVWKPGVVQMLVDNKVYYDSSTSKAHPQVPTDPMHLVIQQEPGPFNPTDWVPAPNAHTPDQVTLHVDWVRLYR